MKRWKGFVQKEGLKAWNERVTGDEMLVIIRINVNSITTVYDSIVKRTL